MTTEEPTTIVPVLIAINSLLATEDCHEWCLRQVNFMSYELQSRSTQLGEQQRFELLNHYLFQEKGYQIVAADRVFSEDDLLIKTVLTYRRGAPLTIALLYLHFAAELEIPMHLLRMTQKVMMKWVRSGHASYVDLNNQGLLLSEHEMLAFLNRLHAMDTRIETLESWKYRQILCRYITEVIKIYEKNECLSHLHVCFNVLVKLDGTNLKHLGRRALLRQKLGLAKDALSDLKRYFSFVERNKAPQDLQVAYFELESLTKDQPRTFH